MPSKEDEHFDDYRPQTRIKHRILSAYLIPYIRILGSRYSRLAVVDGFAGRGSYESSGREEPGSPLITLETLSKLGEPGSRVQSAFVELRPDWFTDLQSSIAAKVATTPNLRTPIIRQGMFHVEVPRILKDLRGRTGRLPPTFLFVDPCGVSGVSFEVIRTVLSEPGGEAFVFFNTSGMRRVLGTSGDQPAVSEFFGSESAAQRLRTRLPHCSTSADREKAMLDVYRDTMKAATGAQFFLPFRIEAESRQDTSHYLVHVTKDPKGFAIMKHVMLDTVSDSEDGGSLLALQQASSAYGSLDSSFNDAIHKLAICDALDVGPQRVRLFSETWVERPEDLLSENQYKRLLKSLEAEGRLRVFSGDSATELTPKPPNKRMRGGKLTLGSSLWVGKT